MRARASVSVSERAALETLSEGGAATWRLGRSSSLSRCGLTRGCYCDVPTVLVRGDHLRQVPPHVLCCSLVGKRCYREEKGCSPQEAGFACRLLLAGTPGCFVVKSFAAGLEQLEVLNAICREERSDHREEKGEKLMKRRKR